jgi:protein O-GlcNAc transferase
LVLARLNTASSLDQTLRLAVKHHQAGRLAEAENLYREILAQDPACADAWHHLALIALQVGQLAAAEEWIGRAATLAPHNPAIHANRGEVYRQLRRWDDAVASFERARALQPDDASILNNLGICLTDQGRTAEAVPQLQRALALQPDFAEAHNSLGSALVREGQLDAALAAFDRALELKPGLAEAHNNRGQLLLQRRQLNAAAEAFELALALNPRLGEVHNNLGVTWTEQHRLDDAATAFQRALSLRADFPSALNNLGYLYIEQGRFDDAFAPLQRALALQPDFAGAHNNLGLAFKELGQIEAAVASFRRALTLDPQRADIHSNLIFSMYYRWGDEPEPIAAELVAWWRQHAGPLTPNIRPHDNDRAAGRRLRVGFVSPDLWAHPVARFLLPLLQAHDHAAFEFHCYADVVREDHMTAELRAHADAWHDIAGRSDDEVVRLVRENQIDVLVDLAQHTARNRLRVFAQKPAPVQWSYLGAPAEPGLETIDGWLTDVWTEPPATPTGPQATPRIRLAQTAWCFSAPTDAPEVGESPAKARGFVTFGCFNNFAKVTDEMLDAWARVLLCVPTARLALKNRALGCLSAATRVRDRFARHGISVARLDFLRPTASYHDHLRCYHEVDLALDTFPYHGTTTTCEALWMGVPVLTRAGRMPATRVGVSLLSNVRLTDFIALSADDYVERAVKLMNDLPRLATLRQELRSRLQHSPLMDGPLFARAVESAMRDAWRQWCENAVRNVADR